MMKVLHIGMLVGGVDIYIRNSIENAKGDFDFEVIHGENDKNKPIIYKGKEVKEYRICMQRELSLRKDIKAIWQAYRIARKEKPDLIHCHSAKGGVIGRVVGWLTHTPTLYTPHAFSFLCTPNKKKRKVYLLMERMARLDSYMLACSESERQLGMEKVGYKQNKALMWSNSVPDFSKQALTEVEPIGTPYIIYIGRPCYQKNMNLLVDVAEKIQNAGANIKMLLLGVGYYSPSLEELESNLAEKRLEDFVIMKPWLSREETYAYVKDALFYLSTSRYEGLPLSIVEAMCQGKAIVATKVVGNIDCVYDGKNGFLAEEDADQLAESCLRLINDEALRKQMGQASRKIYEEQFDIEKRILKLNEIYNSMKHLTNVNSGGKSNSLNNNEFVVLLSYKTRRAA